jgi:hypothetical protein
VRRLSSCGKRYLSIECDPKSRSWKNSGKPITRSYDRDGAFPSDNGLEF